MIAVGLYVLMVGGNKTASRRNGGEGRSDRASQSQLLTGCWGKGHFNFLLVKPEIFALMLRFILHAKLAIAL